MRLTDREWWRRNWGYFLINVIVWLTVVIILVWYTVYTLDKQQEKASPAIITDVIEQPMIYNTARAVFQDIHPLCRHFRRVSTLGGESDAATCTTEFGVSRISVYEAHEDFVDAMHGASGKGIYGQDLTIVTGNYFYIAFPKGEGSGELADEIAARVGGEVKFR